MKISKTIFLNIIKYLRFRNFDHFYTNFPDDLLSSDLSVISYEDDSKLKELVKVSLETFENHSEEDDHELLTAVDSIIKNNDQLSSLMKYYNEVERLSARKLSNLFNGTLTFSMDTNKQKSFEANIDGNTFICYLDGFLENDDEIVVIESKASTTNKYLKLTFKNNKKEDEPLFVYDNKNNLILREEAGLEVNTNYYKKLKALTKKHSDLGKYIYDLSFQRYVIENSLKKPNKEIKYYLALLSSDYVYDGSVDHNGNPIYDDSIITLLDLTNITKGYLTQIEKDVKTVIEIVNNLKSYKNALNYTLNTLKNLPEFKVEYIYKDLLPEKNAITTACAKTSLKNEIGKQKLIADWIKDGVYHITDLPTYSYLENKKLMNQMESINNDLVFIDKKRIEAGINSLKYPIYHLDFETFNAPLPRFKGESPFSQSVFQFSLHIEREPGMCDKDKDHYEFLSTSHKDDRLEMVKYLTSLIKDDGGTILAYNYSFEKQRLEELALIYPEYKDKLLSYVDRAFDLMYLLRGNVSLYESLGFSDEKMYNYYHKDLQGSFSIKNVLPVLVPELSYENLLIPKGTNAVIAYILLPLMNDDQFDKYKEGLLEYCKQDTWAMVEILNVLRKLI